MRRLVFAIMLLATGSAAQAQKPSIVVTDLAATGVVRPVDAVALTDSLVSQLSAARTWEVVGPDARDGLLARRGFRLEGIGDPFNILVVTARYLGVQYAAGGEISKKSGGYELHLWLIETASGKVLTELDKTGLTTLDSTAAVLGMAAAQFGQDLRSGKTDSLRATIRMGGIMVQSKQAGAAIFVDGQPRGRTPALVDSLLPGPHQVMLELEGYQRWYRTILAKRAVKDSIVAVLVLSVPGINSYQAPATAPQKTQPAVDEMVPDKNAYVAVDKNPEAIKQVQPVYPQQAKELGVSGKVYVQMLVDTDGHVIRADLAKSSGNASLDAAAIVAAKQWLFTPAIAPGGKPVRVWVMQAFTFKRD